MKSNGRSMRGEERVDYSDFKPGKFKKKGKWTIVGALDCVLQLAQDSSLSDEFWAAAKQPLRFLTKTLGLTDIQVIAIAILVENGRAMTWRTLGNYLGITRLTMMTYSEEVEELLYKGWIHRSSGHEDGSRYQAFKLNFGVVTALRKNQVFIPEKIDDLDIQRFMDKVERFIAKNLDNYNYTNAEVLEWVGNLIMKNPQLEVCQTLQKISDPNERLILLMIMVDYAQFADSEDEGLWFNNIDQTLDDDFETYDLKRSLKEGNLNIFTQDLVEFKCENGIGNSECYLLSRKFKEEVLRGYEPRRSKVRHTPKEKDNSLMKHDEIKEKTMFYNDEEGRQIEKLGNLLEQEKFEGVQARLKEEGMRQGFACIFYGLPGTGKTETVLQLARQTGRDIMQIDIAGLRDKWVGESEKNIKAVFERYRYACEGEALKPILFFNEADAIFNNRIEETQHSVDKMNNAMQNIILQEIENLDGILIATTNLTGALDKAFERRFLFKVEFKKPEKEVKEQIWNSMFKGKLSDNELRRLATEYDFSGGEIENIARKQAIDYVLEGEELHFDKLCRYCDEERLKHSSRKTIGFSK